MYLATEERFVTKKQNYVKLKQMDWTNTSNQEFIGTKKSTFSLTFVSLLLIMLQGYSQFGVDAHGTMIDPVSRNSLWRVDQSAPVNYDDTELFCGGIGVSSQHQR